MHFFLAGCRLPCIPAPATPPPIDFLRQMCAPNDNKIYKIETCLVDFRLLFGSMIDTEDAVQLKCNWTISTAHNSSFLGCDTGSCWNGSMTPCNFYFADLTLGIINSDCSRVVCFVLSSSSTWTSSSSCTLQLDSLPFSMLLFFFTGHLRTAVHSCVLLPVVVVAAAVAQPTFYQSIDIIITFCAP